MKPCHQLSIAAGEVALGLLAPTTTTTLENQELRVYTYLLPSFGPLFFGVTTDDENPNIYLLQRIETAWQILYKPVIFLGKKADFVEYYNRACREAREVAVAQNDDWVRPKLPH